MSLIQTLTGLAPEILKELETLIYPIIGSKDPYDAIAKAKRNLEWDAIDAATDAGLDAALKKLHGK